ncbi:hypothetical protein HPB51_002435 [Rhipicephalus microplus]|uniref:Transmembrane protein n=1 Tax=Rhipicephalus microplus TaxID=6941 RepID=A0A9J6DEY3_RHIMP|nr:hypothetical protein HPB51_002435 [Rhipicephalus microplus]
MPPRWIVSRESMQSRLRRRQLTTNRLPRNMRAPQPCIKPSARGRRITRIMLQRAEAAGEHKKHEGKHDEQRGTPEKTAGAAVAEQPSSDEKSSPVPPSHASPTGDANAHPPAVDHQPGSGGTGRNVPAAPSSSGSAHSVNQEEEAQRVALREAHTRALVESTWSRTTAILCLLVVLAVALGSLFFKTAEEKAHLLSLLGSEHFTPSSSNLSEAALLQPENETIFGEPRIDNPVFD